MAISRASNSSIQGGLPKFNDIWDGTTATSAFDSLGTVLLSSNATTITFSNIPQIYSHLQLRVSARATRSNSNNNFYIAFNNDTTSTNYYGHYILGDGASASGGSLQLTGMGILFSVAPAATSTSNVFGSSVVDILDYANTSKNTTIRGISGYDANGSGNAGIHAGAWFNSAAVSTLTLQTYFDQYATQTLVSLYGVK